MSIVFVQSTDLRTLTVALNSPSDATAMVPSNWALTCTSAAPFAVPTIVDVDNIKLDFRGFDLSLDFETTPGATYTLTTTGVLNGGSHSFTAIALPVVDGRTSFSLDNWLSSLNWNEDTSGDLNKFVSVINENIFLLINDHDQWINIQDPDLAAERFLDQMLHDFGNPVTDALLNITQKRALVKLLVPIFKSIGTLKGIEDALWFFLGFPTSAVIENRQGMRLGTSLLGVDWILGCGPDKWHFTLKIGTPGGRAFTDYETRVITQIIAAMKCAQERISWHAALPAPTGVTAITAITPTGIRVSWTALSGAVSYLVYMASVAGVTVKNGSPWATTATHLDFPMLAGTTRYFIVCAVNAQGEGLPSSEVTTTAVPA